MLENRWNHFMDNLLLKNFKDLVQKTTRVTTRDSMTQHEYNTRQHDTTRIQGDTTLDNTSTTRNNTNKT